MSTLEQFPVIPKRPRPIPGNEGYVLYRQPGFANEAKVYRIRCTATTSGDSAVVRLNLNYPQIKLGCNNYVLDLERMRFTYQYNNLSVTGTFYINPGYTAVVKGVTPVLECVVDATTKACNCYNSMDYSFFLNQSSVWGRSTVGGIVTTIVTYSKTNEGNGNIDTSIPIEKDCLNMEFDIEDIDLIKNTTFAPGKSISDVTVRREYFFVVRPNPLKSPMFEFSEQPW